MQKTKVVSYLYCSFECPGHYYIESGGKGEREGEKEPTLKVNLEQNCFPKAKANPDIRSITAEHFTELC